MPTEVGWLYLEYGADTVQRRLYMSGRHDERGVVAHLRSLARAGDFDDLDDAMRGRGLRGATVLDVGGHCGFYTMLLADLVGPSGCVVAFEPQPELARSIEASAAANRFGHVRVVRAAAASRDGVVRFHRTADSGHATVSTVGDEPALVLEVPSIELSTWIERHLERPPRVLKLDIEGAEWLVLRAAHELLVNARPHLVVEVHPRQIEGLGGTVEALLEGLDAAGYRLHRLDVDGALKPLEVARRGPWHLVASPRAASSVEVEMKVRPSAESSP